MSHIIFFQHTYHVSVSMPPHELDAMMRVFVKKFTIEQ